MADWSDDETTATKPATKTAAKKPAANNDDWGDEEKVTKPVAKKATADDDWGDSGSTTAVSSSRGASTGVGGSEPRQPRQPRSGDWKCLSCNKDNYANRDECFSCQELKGDAVGITVESDRPARQPRSGDWKCLSCNKDNYANRDECFSCQEPKGDAVGITVESDRPARQPRTGDWNCLSCSKTNYGNREECFSCNESKGDAVGLPPQEGERPPRQPRAGDWKCLGCSKDNFSGREECFSCNAPKGDAVGLPLAEGEKPTEIYNPPEPTNDENEMFGQGISAGINFDKFDKIEVSVSGTGEIHPVPSFENSGLREFLQENVRRSGYTKPTPIQKHAIPIILAKRDLMGCAQTGSGKTAAFLLPILNTIMAENSDLVSGQPQCLIIAPTRELVIQIFEEARKFALKSWVKIAIAYGGTVVRTQGDNITKGCHILVATPGRLMDFVDKSIVTFQSLKFLVLDEADRMLDMGFKETITKIAAHPTASKDKIQTLMFSATFATEIQVLAASFLRDYVFLTVGIVGGASTDVEQEFIEVKKFEKRKKLGATLAEYAKSTEEDRILVFVETKKTADFLAGFMSETKMSTTSIHGDRLQREREEALRNFRQGKHKVLIATSVAARGLDIEGVTHVINYDLPKDIQDYVHRIGRTGRVGNRGKATSFYDPEQDGALAGDLVRILTEAKQPVPEFLGDISGGYGESGDGFGGTDIRQPTAQAQKPAPAPATMDEDDW